MSGADREGAPRTTGGVVSFTPNPSIDRSAAVEGMLTRGGVHRLGALHTEPGGKGVNVARVVHQAGVDALAVLPAGDGDPLLRLISDTGLRHRAHTTAAPARINLTVTESDGTTTKLNEPGTPLSSADVEALRLLLTKAGKGAAWVTLCGSLPPGAPVDWYAQLVPQLRALGVKVAVDTSDAPLAALAAALPGSAPTLVKPNSEELAQLSGQDAGLLESSAEAGDLGPTVKAATRLLELGVEAALVTLGGAGAVLVTAEGAWFSPPTPVVVRSTVGAGDSALAGYLLADLAGMDAPHRLAHAVAHGSAAAALPGTGLPHPGDVHPDPAAVRAL